LSARQIFIDRLTNFGVAYCRTFMKAEIYRRIGVF